MQSFIKPAVKVYQTFLTKVSFEFDNDVQESDGFMQASHDE